MPDLTYFTVEGDMLAIVGDISLGDVDMNPDRLGVRGSVFFTPELTPNVPLLGSTLTPRPALLIPRVIEAQFNESGQLTYHGVVGVRLVANTSVLGLTGNFTYRVSFANMYIGAQKIDNPLPFSFIAPTSDVVRNLVDVARVPGSTGVGMSRGAPGFPVDDVTLTVDDEIQFWVQGDPIGDPIPFPDAEALQGGALNVRHYGAVGDGVTDDSAAFLAAYTAAVASSVPGFGLGGNRAIHSIYVPAGTYIIKENGCFLADLGITFTSGLKYHGDGLEASKVVFDPSSADGYLATNQNDHAFLTFEDMSFWGTGIHADTATFLKSHATLGNRCHRFNRINWGGTWKYGLDLTGTNNNDTMSWADCGIYGDWTSFLHVPPTAGAGYGDQFVFFTFLNPEVEYISGDFIDMAYGGAILILNGSFVHIGDGDQTTSSDQCFFKLGVGADPPGGHSQGAQNFTMIGGRVEHRHNKSKLIQSEWTAGNITFTGIITDPMQTYLATPTAVEQAEFGSAEVVATNAGRPNILFQNSILLGYHKYHYGPASSLDKANIKYDNCTIESFEQAADFIEYVDNASLGLIVGRPPVKFVDCHSAISQFDYAAVFDCTVGFPTIGPRSMEQKIVTAQQPWGGPPYVGAPGTATVDIHLPLNAIITRVRGIKGVSGGDPSTTFTYTITNADGDTVEQVNGGGLYWHLGWTYDSGALRYSCSTDNRRKLTVTAANIADSTLDCQLFIEYLA
jgi:hypothetical protein